VIGDRLEPKGFVAVAARKGVPIFCGATSDSELALDLAKYRAEDLMIVLDEIGDVITFSKLIESHSTYGNIIVGGGVPRNWAQQVFPYLDQVHGEVGESRFTGFNYSVRFHTATELDGGLSGCTVSEGKSWGKYATEANHVSVWGDSTINLPLLVTALIQRLAQLRA
jgi:deoxyhypusine synthase